MKERLIAFLEEEELSASKLAEIIDVQASSISHILSERNKPGFDFLAKLFSAFPKLNPRWLILGVENMYINENIDCSPQKQVGYPNETDVPEIISRKTGVTKIVLFFSDNTFESYEKK